MDIGEGMCYGKRCEMCKPDDSQTCTLGQIIHYRLIKKLKKERSGVPGWLSQLSVCLQLRS